jgi:hypothetical protein
MIYIWQVLSYQAMEHIYLGQVEMGLRVIKLIYDRIYEKGNVWSADLMGSGNAIYMTNTVIWAVLNALTGAALDVPRGLLTLSPQKLPGQMETRIPICFPRFWGMTMVETETDTVEIEIKKHFEKPVILNTVRLRNQLIHLDPPWECAQGSTRKLCVK